MIQTRCKQRGTDLSIFLDRDPFANDQSAVINQACNCNVSISLVRFARQNVQGGKKSLSVIIIDDFYTFDGNTCKEQFACGKTDFDLEFQKWQKSFLIIQHCGRVRLNSDFMVGRLWMSMDDNYVVFIFRI